MNFRFVPGARLDLNELVDWYEAQYPGPGARFATAFDATLHGILTCPHAHGRVTRAPRRREVREAMVPPFQVLLTPELTAGEVVILSVTHARSARGPWRRWLP